MGNYLHNLAARALGQSLSVQPRLPSLFEPPSAALRAQQTSFAAIRPDPGRRVAGEEESPTAGAHISRSEKSSTKPVLAVHTDVNVRQEPQEQPRLPRAVAHRNLAYSQAQTPLSTGDEIQQPDFSVSRPPGFRPRITAPAIAAAEHQDRPAEERKEKALQAAPPVGAQSAQAVRSLRQPESGVETTNSSRHDPERSPVQTQSALKSATASAPPDFQAVATVQRIQTERPDLTPEPSPTIHVVIGRISVQAVMPPPAPYRPAPPPPSPLLSLEQYLKQRGGES